MHFNIVIYSVSRFARNVLDCIGYVRKLAALNPPIGVFFETENIYTLNANSEMSLSFISTLAQEESHNKSEIMNASIEMRFRRGIFLTPPLLGYDHDEDGNLVINEDEAKTVRLIFFMYLYGYTCQEIANTLTDLGRRTKKDNTIWSPGSIMQILQNERHCGDVLARKTWTPSYLDHKSKKNRQDRNQYRQKNHHEPIISRDDFIAVQRLISNAKYGNKGILPELKVIPDGLLRGFVSINPRWSGFKANDYRLASESIYDPVIELPGQPLKVNRGDFDLRGYEVARAQFFDTGNKICITFSSTIIKFSTECVKKFDTQYIELFVHPGKDQLVARPASKQDKNAVQWSRQSEGKVLSKQISGAAFLPNLYELFGWNTERKYRIIGVKKQFGDDSLLFFNLQDTEVLIPNKLLQTDEDEDGSPIFEENVKPLGTQKNILAYPMSWTHTFGNNYYSQAQAAELATQTDEDDWNIRAEGTAYHPEPPLQVTSKADIERHIETIIDDMKQEVSDERSNSDE